MPPPDPSRIEDTRAWLRKADEDLRAGDHQASSEPPFLADAAFHAQQACGKVMKGFLAWNDHPFGKTHHLVELGDMCVAMAPDLEPLLRRAGPLTEYAWRFRYPGDPDAPDRGEVSSVLEVARLVVRAILDGLPPEVRG